MSPASEDLSLSYDGEHCILSIKRVYPEDEGEYRCIASNNIGKTVSSACIIVDGMLNMVFILLKLFRAANCKRKFIQN